MRGYRRLTALRAPKPTPEAQVLRVLVWLDGGEENVAAALVNLMEDVVQYGAPAGVRAWSVAGLADAGMVGYACWPEDSEEFERRIGQ